MGAPINAAQNAAQVEALLAQMRARREFWVELEDANHPGLAVQLRRPADGEMAPFVQRDGEQAYIVANREAIRTSAVGWRGMTQAVLLGPAIGAADEVLFHADLWGELLLERPVWVAACRTALIEAITAHLNQQAEDTKN